ncbi:MAG TPA: tetratricopeptide repeat protein [Chloroflexota bacterium]
MNRLQTLMIAASDKVAEIMQQPSLRAARQQGSRSNAKSFSQAAWQELERRQFVRAAYLAKMAIAFDPMWGDGYRALGLSYLRKGRPDLARRTYTEGASVLPENGYIMSSLGDLEWDLKRYQEAEVAYRRALELTPQHRDAQRLVVNLALSIYRQDRVDEAAVLLERERRRGANHVPLLLSLGEIRLHQKRDAEATVVFREAIAQDPLVAQAHYDLGYALQRMGEWQSALPEIRRAIELDPNHADYPTALAQLEQGTQPTA